MKTEAIGDNNDRQSQEEMQKMVDGMLAKEQKEKKVSNVSRNEPPKSIVHIVESYLLENYDLIYNEITKRIELKTKLVDNYKPMEDRDFNSILCGFIKVNEKHPGIPLFQTIINSDIVKSFDPFDEYFRSLTWDGKTDYINILSDTVETTNQDFFKRAFKKWIVAVVACALKIRENHAALILSGDQAFHKTTWLKALIPTKLKDYICDEVINPHNKDFMFNVLESLLVNFDELQSIGKYGMMDIKSLLTGNKYKKRRPYARFSDSYQRRASFMGSLNGDEFLADPTGNRRFLCFRVTKKINTQHGINMDDVFGQAHYLLQNGENEQPFKYYFDADDEKELETNNAPFCRISTEEELVLKYFEVPSPDDKEMLITPTDMIYIINCLEGHAILKETSRMKLGEALKKHGFTKKSVDNRKPYYVKTRQVQANPPLFGKRRA